MQIFIEGYDINNWGDVLMATASVLLAGHARPDAKIVLPRALPLSEEDQAALFKEVKCKIAEPASGLLSYLEPKRRAFEISAAARRAGPQDAVLFCNGFIFGDHWKLQRLSSLYGSFKHLKRRGAQLILMPQSFGPFADHAKARVVRAALDSADLIFARDRQSSDFLRTLGLPEDRFVTSIDYTGILSRFLPPGVAGSRCNRMVIIPNIKIQKRFGEALEEQYVRQLVELAGAARTHGVGEIAVAEHTHGKDRALAERIASLCGTAVVRGDPIYLRRFIQDSRFVISSRFHGLVNALSQGVPGIAIGWSHKYDQIMAAYGVEDFAVDITRQASLEPVLRKLVAEEEGLRERLRMANRQLEAGLYAELQQQLVSALARRTLAPAANA
jgi:polysaccharide pyruvyl transferase WcaK-like protein